MEEQIEAVGIQSGLTSTMGNTFGFQKSEKNDATDFTPTSSTDAAFASQPDTLQTANDDAISSTCTEIIGKKSPIDGDVVDLLDINMVQVSLEPISEDVEDIVQDLQNLLGEPEPVNDFSLRRKQAAMKRDAPSDTTEVSTELEMMLPSLEEISESNPGVESVAEVVSSEINPERRDQAAEFVEKTENTQHLAEVTDKIAQKTDSVAEDSIKVLEEEQREVCGETAVADTSKTVETTEETDQNVCVDEIVQQIDSFTEEGIKILEGKQTEVCDETAVADTTETMESTQETVQSVVCVDEIVQQADSVVADSIDILEEQREVSDETAVADTTKVMESKEEVEQTDDPVIEDTTDKKVSTEHTEYSSGIVEKSVTMEENKASSPVSAEMESADEGANRIFKQVEESTEKPVILTRELSEEIEAKEEILSTEETNEVLKEEFTEEPIITTRELSEQTEIEEEVRPSEERNEILKKEFSEKPVLITENSNEQTETELATTNDEQEFINTDEKAVVEATVVAQKDEDEGDNETLKVENVDKLPEKIIVPIETQQQMSENAEVVDKIAEISEESVEQMKDIEGTEKNVETKLSCGNSQSETNDNSQEDLNEIEKSDEIESRQVDEVDKTDDKQIREELKVEEVCSTNNEIKEIQEDNETREVQVGTEIKEVQVAIEIKDVHVETEIKDQENKEVEEVQADTEVKEVQADTKITKVQAEIKTPETEEKSVIPIDQEESATSSKHSETPEIEVEHTELKQDVANSANSVKSTSEVLMWQKLESEIEEKTIPLQHHEEPVLTQLSEEEDKTEVIDNSVVKSVELNAEEKDASPVPVNIECKEAAEPSIGESSMDYNKLNEYPDKLTPVVEELCVKKTIIYKHDCHSHTDQEEEKDRMDVAKQTDDNVPHKKSEEVCNAESDKKLSQSSLEEKVKEDAPLATSNKATTVQSKEAEHENEKVEEVACAIKVVPDNIVETIQTVTKENVQSDSINIQNEEQSNVIKSSDKIPELTVGQDKKNENESTSGEKPIKELAKENDQLSKSDDVPTPLIEKISVNADTSLHDQTTAAVQSLLDNMLAEDQHKKAVAEKDEPPVVHSGYSSYELQKAVLQIQDVSVVEGEAHAQETPPFIVQQSENIGAVQPPHVFSNSGPQDSPCIEPVEVKKVESTAKPVIETKEDTPKSLPVPIVEPSVNLSEDSSSEDEAPPKVNILKKTLQKETRHSTRSSDRIKDKSIVIKENLSEPLTVNIDETERDKPYSPKIIIKPLKEEESLDEKEEHKGSLKMTITKQSGNTHSILKMCSPDSEIRLKFAQQQQQDDEQNVVPKLVIKTSDVDSHQHSPKMSTRSSKQSTASTTNQRSASPRITIKPIVKPADATTGSPLKITIKPLGKPEEFSKQQQRHSPKTTKIKSDDDHHNLRGKILKSTENSDVHNPKVTIKPIIKPLEANELQTPLPKITIKPIEKPEIEAKISPKITIKPIEKPEVELKVSPKVTIKPIEKPESETKASPKITIKPVVRPVADCDQEDDEVKKRIVLKINKGSIPKENDKEKLAKIKLKFSKGGDARIVHDNETPTSTNKRNQEHDTEKPKKARLSNPGHESDDDDVRIIEDRQSPIVISEDSQSQDSVIILETRKETPPAVEPEPLPPPPPAPKKRGRPRKVPLVIREDFTENTAQKEQPAPPPPLEPTEFCSGRPKRSCRGQSVRDTLGIKPRKPKTTSRGRGGKRGGRGGAAKAAKAPAIGETKIESIRRSLTEEAPLSASNILRLLKEDTSVQLKTSLLEESSQQEQPPPGQNFIEVIEIDTPSNSPRSVHVEDPLKDVSVDLKDEVEMQPPTPLLARSSDIVLFEEETRMSAEVSGSSRAQTPAKQVLSTPMDIVEESQSSMQSTATTESAKNRRSRLEVTHELDMSIPGSLQLNEYYWAGNGPFMIQEQVAQFLGIKSFKRKYPGIPRRVVDMQERDYIRENGLASESMCDLGLTAVNSADILDIMYSDFQDKYEEYCKHQREKQARDLLNKQKALNLAASLEKNKQDILEQAVQSAAAYNSNFNKMRREQRRACMDLQTMSVHYPKGKMKKFTYQNSGHYPVAVVPGQFTDYYREFTPTELNNMPLNTMLYNELHKIVPAATDSDSESSASESDDSSSSGSDSESSCGDSCKMCSSGERKGVTARKSPIHAGV